jgi:hypothetical protein
VSRAPTFDQLQASVRHDGGMTIPEVWISTTTPDITRDGENPGDQWQLVGTIHTTQESEFWQHIKVLLGLRRTSPRNAEFYLSGDPDSDWVQAANRDPRSQKPFWLAIDPYGATGIRYTDVASRKYFVSTEKATALTGLTRRPPEPHPGDIVRPVMIGIRLKRNSSGFFVPQQSPRPAGFA